MPRIVDNYPDIQLINELKSISEGVSGFGGGNSINAGFGAGGLGRVGAMPGGFYQPGQGAAPVPQLSTNPMNEPSLVSNIPPADLPRRELGLRTPTQEIQRNFGTGTPRTGQQVHDLANASRAAQGVTTTFEQEIAQRKARHANAIAILQARKGRGSSNPYEGVVNAQFAKARAEDFQTQTTAEQKQKFVLEQIKARAAARISAGKPPKSPSMNDLKSFLPDDFSSKSSGEKVKIIQNAKKTFHQAMTGIDPEKITDEDVKFTAEKYGMTEAEVRKQMGID